jgi:acyl-coenzyme A synthetase/AMP-(fatty) acid ligase
VIRNIEAGGIVARDRSLIFDQLWKASPSAPRWIVDHGSAAVRVDDDQVTQRAVALAAGRAASMFESQGTRVGDRCVVWLDLPLDIAIVVAALTAIGAVPILISPAMDVETLTSVLSPLPPVTRVITTASRARSCTAIDVHERIDDWASLSAELDRFAPRRWSIPLPETAPYLVTHTSGTTGVNKLVEYTRAAADHNSYTQEVPARLGRLRGYAAIAVSPVHFRFVVGLLAALRRKVPLVILADHEPESVGPMLERWQPTYLETHPNTFMKWEGLVAAGAFASVKCFLSTFDVIHPGTIKNLLAGSRSRFAFFIEIYGQSEVCAIAGRLHVKGFVGRLSERDTARRLTGHLVGWIVPGHSRTRIVDDRGRIVAPRTGGRIQVRSTGRFTTYLNRPEAAMQSLTADGWWDTGDYGKKDRVGRLTLIDRQVERLSVIPSAIAMEDVLLDRMPCLLEAIVLERGRSLVPVVVTRGSDFDRSRWQAATRGLPRLGVPVVLEDGAIPRTATGKVQRAVLAELVHDLDRRESRPEALQGSVETIGEYVS